jgi:hypothetical protein
MIQKYGRITQPGGLVTRVIKGYMKDILSPVLFKPFSDLAYKNIKGASSCIQLNYIYICIVCVCECVRACVM